MYISDHFSVFNRVPGCVHVKYERVRIDFPMVATMSSLDFYRFTFPNLLILKKPDHFYLW